MGVLPALHSPSQDRVDLSHPVALGDCLPQKPYPQATVPVVGRTANPRWPSPTSPPRAPGLLWTRVHGVQRGGFGALRRGRSAPGLGWRLPASRLFPYPSSLCSPRGWERQDIQDRSQETFPGPSVFVGPPGPGVAAPMPPISLPYLGALLFASSSHHDINRQPVARRAQVFGRKKNLSGIQIPQDQRAERVGWSCLL